MCIHTSSDTKLNFQATHLDLFLMMLNIKGLVSINQDVVMLVTKALKAL